jgi:hydrogenase maturation protease
MTGQSVTPCRVLIGGFGRPGMRDLDFGRQVVEYLQQLEWPDGVIVEDLSCSAPLVLHRLQELRPAKVVLLGAVARDLDPPATIRRYQVDLTPPGPAAVHRSVEESVMGLVDLDHTLAMARHWGGLPVDTVVIEVEPAEASFGLGFSEALSACLDPLLDMVRAELAGMADDVGRHRDFDARDILTCGSPSADAGAVPAAVEPSEALHGLLGYAHHHAQARLQTHRAPNLVGRLSSDVPGVALAGRLRPWGVFVESGGDWFDAGPLGGGALGIVVGNVDGRGVEAAAAMSDLRAAVRAYVVLDGDSPSRLLGHLDRLAESTGLGHQARLLYLTLQPATGEVRYANAGGCPPLLVDDRVAQGRFVDSAGGPPVGAVARDDRGEGTLRLSADSTLLLFTDGLVESRAVSRAAGMDRLRLAASEGPEELGDLCEHALTVCTGGLRRDDDICLLGVRLVADAVRTPKRRSPSLELPPSTVS